MNEFAEPTADDAVQPDGSRCISRYRLVDRPETCNFPVLICFHGSGSDSLRNWELLLGLLSQKYSTVFFDRGPRNPLPEEHLKVLWAFLEQQRLIGPYILVAHSYGGMFAKSFLQAHRGRVGGMVLVETGKGGPLNHLQATLSKETRLGSRPLSVIRGNSFLRQRQALKADVGDNGMVTRGQTHKDREEWLTSCEAEDEKLEKDQLRLSNNSRFVHLPDCGHNVVLERPDAVLQEVDWVVAQCKTQGSKVSWLTRATKMVLGRQ